MFLKFDIYHTI